MNIEPISWEDYAARPGVRNSSLKWIAPPDHFPAHYRARFITGEIKDEETPAKRFGTLCHRLCLQPDTMRQAFHVEPAELTIEEARLKKLKSAKMIGFPEGGKAQVEWNSAFVEADQWRAEHADRPILKRDEADTAMRCRDAVWAHPGARRILRGALTEVSIFETEDGVARKARIDALPNGVRSDKVADLKFVQSVGGDAIEKAIFEYRWFCQGAYYLDLLKLAGEKRDVFTFIFVEKSPPYLVTVRTLSEEVESIGRRVYRSDLARLKTCLETNVWPGDPMDGQDVGIPSWAASKFQQSFE